MFEYAVLLYLCKVMKRYFIEIDFKMHLQIYFHPILTMFGYEYLPMKSLYSAVLVNTV